jgi:peptide/nickel transport system permease protein
MVYMKDATANVSDISLVLKNMQQKNRPKFMWSDSLTMATLKRFSGQPLAMTGAGVVVFLVLTALFAPLIAPYSPYAINSGVPFMSAPAGSHLLGIDQVGRDIFSRLIYASRISLLTGLCATFFSIVIGTFLGLMAGYYQGVTDMIIMRITDVFMSFSKLLVSLVIISIVGGSLWMLILVLGLLGWPQIARLVRGCVLVEKRSLYAEAGFAMGFGSPRIIFNHIFPNIAAPIIVNATFATASNIMMEASLSFLGMGIQPPVSSWGNMLNSAQSLSVLMSKPWFWAPPGILIFITILSINFIGDGLRDAMDPKKNQILK